MKKSSLFLVSFLALFSHAEDSPAQVEVSVNNTNILLPFPKDGVLVCKDERILNTLQNNFPSSHIVLSCFSSPDIKKGGIFGENIYTISTYKDMVSHKFNQETFVQVYSGIENRINSGRKTNINFIKKEGMHEERNDEKVLSKGPNYISWFKRDDVFMQGKKVKSVAIYHALLNIKGKLVEIGITGDYARHGKEEVINIGNKWRDEILSQYY